MPNMNLQQVFVVNPVTTIGNTDLMYVDVAGTTDAAITGANLKLQFLSGAAIPSHDILSNITGGSAIPIANTLTATIDAAIGSTQGNILYRNATNWTVLAPGTTGQFLQTQGAASDVQWASPSGSGVVSAGTINQLTWYAANGTTVSGLATVVAGVLTTVTSVPTWQTFLPIALGGTSVTSVTTSPAATSFAGWDANKNLSANNFLGGYTTTATAGTTTTLLVSSTEQQYFTGTLTQTIKLPVTSTLAPGQSFTIVNKSTQSLTVQSSGSNTISTILAGYNGVFTCVLTSGTTAASWSPSLSSGSAGIQFISNGITPTAGPTVTFSANSEGGTAFFYSSGTSLNLKFTDVGDSVFLGRLTPTSLNGTGGFACVGIGAQAFQSALTNGLSVGIGDGALTSDQSGQYNVGIGALVFTNLNGGNNNVGIGYQAGYGYTGTESNNIIIGSNVLGTISESDTIRIGDGTRTRFFAGGIDGVNVGSSTVRLVSESGTQLGTIDLVAGSGVTITPSANQISISASGGMTWSTITADQTAVVNNGYVTNKNTLLSLTLPAVCDVGDQVAINGENAGLWSGIANTGQTIIYNNSSSTTAGSLTATQQYDTVIFQCLVTNTVWIVTSTISTNLVLA